MLDVALSGVKGFTSSLGSITFPILFLPILPPFVPARLLPLLLVFPALLFLSFHVEAATVENQENDRFKLLYLSQVLLLILSRLSMDRKASSLVSVNKSN